MAEFTRSVICIFCGKNNKSNLFNVSAELCQNDSQFTKLKNNFSDNLYNFIKAYENEMLNADPIIGISAVDTVNQLNAQFLAQLKAHLAGRIDQTKYSSWDETVAIPFSWSEGYDVKSSRYKQHGNLADWNMDSGVAFSVREDIQATTANYSNPYYDVALTSPTESCQENYYSTNDNKQNINITYADQQDSNTSYLISMFENDFGFKNMNKGKLYGEGIGRQNPQYDARLVSRQIFRKDAHGVENGVPHYERRLQRRNLDRNITETLRAAEYDYKQRGHDMQSLYDRTDQHRAYRAAHENDNFDYNNKYL